MEYWESGVAKYNVGDYYGAIAYYTKSIDIVDLDIALYQRGVLKENLELPCCSDFKKACDLGKSDCCDWFNNQCK